MLTAETAPLVKYLKADLQRIVNSANEELRNIRCAGLVDSTRQAEEARVINDARAFAVRRVESTVRHLHNMKSKLPAKHRPVNGVDETEKTTRFKLAPPRLDPDQTTVIPVVEASAPVSPGSVQPKPPPAQESIEQPDQWEPPADVPDVAQAEARDFHAFEPAPTKPEAWEPEQPYAEESAPKHAFDSDDTEVLEELATLLQEISPHTEPPATPPVEPPPISAPEPPVETTSRHAEPDVDDTEATRHLPVAEPGESETRTAGTHSEVRRPARTRPALGRRRPRRRHHVACHRPCPRMDTAGNQAARRSPAAGAGPAKRHRCGPARPDHAVWRPMRRATRWAGRPITRSPTPRRTPRAAGGRRPRMGARRGDALARRPAADGQHAGQGGRGRTPASSMPRSTYCASTSTPRGTNSWRSTPTSTQGYC